jgi:hypothetical protein
MVYPYSLTPQQALSQARRSLPTPPVQPGCGVDPQRNKDFSPLPDYCALPVHEQRKTRSVLRWYCAPVHG